MIIVNQNRDIIVNFDNIESIDIVATLDGTGEVPYQIYYETSAKREKLGEYKTEERAKEVLREIINTYKDCNIGGFGLEYGYVANKVYEMPEEWLEWKIDQMKKLLKS